MQSMADRVSGAALSPTLDYPPPTLDYPGHVSCRSDIRIDSFRNYLLPNSDIHGQHTGPGHGR